MRVCSDRMVRPLTIFALVVSASLFIHADDATPPLRHIVNDAFGVGERLEYSVGYKFIKAGTASFTIGKQPVTSAGRPCYDIRFEVASLKSLDFLYRVRDRYRTLVDIDGIFPWKFEQSIREGASRRTSQRRLIMSGKQHRPAKERSRFRRLCMTLSRPFTTSVR